MSQSLRILLGVSGGIAAYKSADLVRRLSERGASVRVVMTEAATQFVTPLTFQALSGHEVRTQLWDDRAEAGMGHIELAKWADHIVIAPASADLLARLAMGQANDLLTTLCLATTAKLWLAPAMNQQMWSHPAVQQNLAVLSSRGAEVLGPASGSQACGDEGLGRMLEPLAIAEQLFSSSAQPEGLSLKGLKVVISAGPTREPLDPVRFITNRSSGKMGYAVAHAAYLQGAEVVLVSGPVHLETPRGVKRINVETAEQMQAAVLQEITDSAIYIGAAAVADYQPRQCADNKIKKNQDELTVCLTRAPDILKSIQALERRPFTVGFAAETENVTENARGKLLRKSLDVIAANHVGHNKGFDCDENELLVLWADGEQRLALKSKQELAKELVQVLATRYHQRHGR